MSKFLVLTKYLLKSSLTALSQGKRNRKMPPYAMPVILLIILFTSISIPLAQGISYVYDILAQINQEGAILTLFITTVSLVIFIFGILYVMSIFYFAKDVEFLLPLPLRPSEILGAKFVSVLVYEYFTELIILGPALVVFGYRSGASPLYYIYSLILFLTIPVIPLVIASLLDIVIMRFTNLGKHKDAMRIISGIFAIGFGIGVNVMMQKIAVNGQQSQDFVQRLFNEKNSLVDVLSKIFPTSKLASYSLIYSTDTKGLINMILFFVISAAVLFIFIMFAEGLYIKGALGNAEVYSKRRNLSKEEFNRNVKQSSHLKAYTMKELRILLRTPAFLMNCVLVDYLFPVIMVAALYFSNGVKKQNMEQIFDALKDMKAMGIILAAMFALAIVLSGMNGIASTSISREGQSIYVVKYLPIRLKDQLMARAMSAFIISFPPVLLLVVIAYVFLRLSPVIIVPAIILVVIGIFFTSFLGLVIDMRFPKLKWDNEQAAVKQNLNLIFTMFGSMALSALVIFLVAKFSLGLWTAFACIAVVFGVVEIVLYRVLLTSGQRWFNDINP